MNTHARPNGDTKPLTILLVEDDDGDAEAVQRSFQRARIVSPIIRSVDGMDALDLLKGANGRVKPPAPYVLLVDLNMPRMSGIQFVKVLREDQELRHSIVFILTTSDNTKDVMAAYDLNVAGYILKETAGHNFMNLVTLVDSYWRIVEMP